MTIAVTGATGFVGHAVMEALSGQSVRALTRREQAEREGVEWVQGDLHNQEALEQLCDGTDALIHIAGLTNTPDPAEFEAANVTGTANIIAAMKRAKCKRLVFVSSLSARKPELSSYGASKAEAEKLVEARGDVHHLCL